jgi:hypothetical protein
MRKPSANAPSAVASSRPELRLDWCTHEAAKYACEKWHYSRCVPNQKTVKVGVWESARFIGCVLFGDGANNHMFQPYGLTAFQGCELVRIALAQHKTPVSRIVRIALAKLREACPGLRLVSSFADPEHGHTGGIYQAGGWLYTGKTEPSDEYIVNGRRMHGRALRSTRSTHRLKNVPAQNIYDWTRKVLDPNVRPVQGSSKYRYLMPLDDDMRAKLLPLAKPYPKRATSLDSEAPANHAGEGGAIPTVALPTSAGVRDG